MSQRRMFCKNITWSSDFIQMPQSAQNLYFHLGMNGDDDGFCETVMVLRMTQCNQADLDLLVKKNLVYVVNDEVCILPDWHRHNRIQNDRYQSSKYLENPKIAAVYKKVMPEKYLIFKRYKRLYVENKQQELILDTQPVQNESKNGTQYSIGKVSIVKETPLLAAKPAKPKASKPTDLFEEFWKVFPKKIGKQKAKAEWEKLKLSKELAQQIITHVDARSKTTWIREGKRFVIYAERFLKQHRWEDSLAEYEPLDIQEEAGYLNLNKPANV